MLPSGGSLYPNKLQSQGQVRVYPTGPARLLIYGFKWKIIQMTNAPYSQYTFFWKHINNTPMYSLTCCAKMDSQMYVVHHKTRNISMEHQHSPSSACVTLWRQLQTRFWDASPRASVQKQQAMKFSFFHRVLTNYCWFFLYEFMNE